MPDLMRAAGEPVTVKLGDKEYTLSPITIGDLAKFERNIKQQRLQDFIDAAAVAKMSKEERIEGITRILTAPFTAEDFASSLNSIQAIRFLLWSSISKKHPKFQITEVDELGNLEDLAVIVNSISNLGRMTESPPVENQTSE